MKHQQHFQKESGIARWTVVTALALVIAAVTWAAVQSMGKKSVTIRGRQIGLIALSSRP